MMKNMIAKRYAALSGGGTFSTGFLGLIMGATLVSTPEQVSAQDACQQVQCPNGTHCSLYNGRPTCFRDGTSATPRATSRITTGGNNSLAGTRSGNIEFFRPTGTSAKPCPDGSQYLRSRGVCMRRITGKENVQENGSVNALSTRSNQTESIRSVPAAPAVHRPSLRPEPVAPVAPEPEIDEPDPIFNFSQCRTGYLFNSSTNKCVVDREAVMRLYCQRIGKSYTNFQCR